MILTTTIVPENELDKIFSSLAGTVFLIRFLLKIGFLHQISLFTNDLFHYQIFTEEYCYTGKCYMHITFKSIILSYGAADFFYIGASPYFMQTGMREIFGW